MLIGYYALLIYAVAAFGTLSVLGWMILKIGTLLGDCLLVAPLQCSRPANSPPLSGCLGL